MFGTGVLEDDDSRIEQGEAFDRLVGFVRGIDGVFVFLIFAGWRELGGFVFGDDLDGGRFNRRTAFSIICLTRSG